MKKNKVLYIVLTLLTVLSLTSIAAKNNTIVLTANLTGAAEVPGPGDPDGSGHATITINYGQGTLCWEIKVSGITLPATAAHIHDAPAGVPGPVFVGLSAPGSKGAASGCASVDRTKLKAIIDNPAAYYVNVHNADHPGGALRGQLTP